jgi:hypothetical protein
MFTRRLYAVAVTLLAVLLIALGGATTVSGKGPPPTDTPAGPTPTPGGSQQITVYGAWHCSDDYCTWAAVRDMANFDWANHWLIDRADGSGEPSANIVILAFVNPLTLLNKTTDAGNVNGVPVGMNADVINYFKNQGIRVMFSIGGFTYADDWNTALDTDPVQLGLNAAEMANNYDVGVEIDYEESSEPRLAALGQFISAYRSVISYDASGNNDAARLTIDLAVGNRYLTKISREASEKWLQTENPVLDYINAMVPGKQTPTTDQWQEHIDGMPHYNPPVLPKAPAKVAGSLWLTKGNNPIDNCTDYSGSTQKSHADYVQTVAPNGEGTTNGMLGYMFWAAECPSTRNACTTPADATCEGGMGAGMRELDVAFPMPALRQE